MDYASKRAEEEKTDIKVENMNPAEKEIFENGGLTNEEKAEKEKYWITGFVEWNKDEFALFLKGCEKFGRKEYKQISDLIQTKNPKEVQDYSKVFWKRITELPEYQKHQKNIERGEQQLQTRSQAKELVEGKCRSYKNPKEDIEFNMVHYNKSRSKQYSLDHDKFLVYASYLQGYGNFDKVKHMVKVEPFFRFDAFIKSRTESELHKRMQSLLKVLEKEKENPNAVSASVAQKEEAAAKKEKKREKSKEGGEKVEGAGEGSDSDKSFLIKKKNKKDKYGSDSDDDKESGKKQQTRDERAKERELKKEQATIDKIRKKEEKEKRKKEKEEKKLKQTSILSFSKVLDKEEMKEGELNGEATKNGDHNDDDADDDKDSDEESESPIRKKGDSKKRKHDEVDNHDDPVEQEMTKVVKSPEDKDNTDSPKV